MTLQNESPTWQGEALKKCACGGRCKQVDSSIKKTTSQVKLSLDARQALAEPSYQLEITNPPKRAATAERGVERETTSNLDPQDTEKTEDCQDYQTRIVEAMKRHFDRQRP
jgi:hypothetical protein